MKEKFGFSEKKKTRDNLIKETKKFKFKNAFYTIYIRYIYF